MKWLKHTLFSLRSDYLLRGYLVGFSYATVILLAANADRTAGISRGYVFLCLIMAFLYPYASFVFDSIVDFIHGRATRFYNMDLSHFLEKFFKTFFIYLFSLILAPFGLIYLGCQARKLH